MKKVWPRDIRLQGFVKLKLLEFNFMQVNCQIISPDYNVFDCTSNEILT